MTTLTVGGLPGTGTSTLCGLLKERLSLPYVYAGRLFRDAAEARGMSLADFGALCETDPSVDKQLDIKQVKLLHEGELILEGRLAGQMAFRNAIPAFKVWITCAHDERIRRIAERDGGKHEIQEKLTLAREESERSRYMDYYGIDLADTSVYDLVLDSTMARPEELADAVLAALESA